MMNHNEFFTHGQNGPWWASPTAPMPPPGWKLVPLETPAKPKEPEKKQEVFNFGPGGPTWMPPPGTRWQLVEEKKEEKKPAEKKEKKEKQPELVMKVRMCCETCVDKLKEELEEVEGVTDVKPDKVHSKVTVVGKVEKSRVLRKAKKVDPKAKFITETKKPYEKKDGGESSGGKAAIANVVDNPPPYNYYKGLYYPPPFMGLVPNSAPAFKESDPYRPSQSYPPNYNYYPESDYYNYPYYNPHYLPHIKHY